MNSFMIANITSTCKRQFRGLISACPIQKCLPFPFNLARNLGTHLKEKLTNFFLKATRVFPIPRQAEQREDGEHLLMVNINPNVRNSLDDKSMLVTPFYLM